MKRLALLLLLACGGESDERAPSTEAGPESAPVAEQEPERCVGLAARVEVPGQERRIDGSVWDDGAFTSQAAKAQFCAEYGECSEAWFCRN